MSIENYRDLDCEANGMTSIAQSHHLHIPRGYDSTKLLKKVGEEAMETIRKPTMDNDEMREIERGQTFPLYNFFR